MTSLLFLVISLLFLISSWLFLILFLLLIYYSFSLLCRITSLLLLFLFLIISYYLFIISYHFSITSLVFLIISGWHRQTSKVHSLFMLSTVNGSIHCDHSLLWLWLRQSTVLLDAPAVGYTIVHWGFSDWPPSDNRDSDREYDAGATAPTWRPGRKQSSKLVDFKTEREPWERERQKKQWCCSSDGWITRYEDKLNNG